MKGFKIGVYNTPIARIERNEYFKYTNTKKLSLPSLRKVIARAISQIATAIEEFLMDVHGYRDYSLVYKSLN